MGLEDLIRFEPNTVAKSSEVNHNFDLLVDEINNIESDTSEIYNNIENMNANKADINGDPNKVFSVARATESYHAVNKGMLEEYIGNMIYYVSGLVVTKDPNSNDTIIVSKGVCYDVNGEKQLKLDTNTSKQNTGQLASQTYYVFITGDDQNSVEINISLDENTPTNIATYPYYRLLASFTTNSSNIIDNVISYSNDAKDQSSSFVSLNMTTTQDRQTRLDTVIPNDGNLYLVWIYSKIYGGGSDASTTIETDVLTPARAFQQLDHDLNDHMSKAVDIIAVPVGNGRWVRTNKTCTIIGYARL